MMSKKERISSAKAAFFIGVIFLCMTGLLGFSGWFLEKELGERNGPAISYEMSFDTYIAAVPDKAEAASGMTFRVFKMPVNHFKSASFSDWLKLHILDGGFCIIPLFMAVIFSSIGLFCLLFIKDKRLERELSLEVLKADLTY